MRCANTVGKVTIMEAMVVPSSAYRFLSRRRLEGERDVGSPPAMYLPAAICANCVDQRIFGKPLPSLSHRIVGCCEPGRASMSSRACRSQKLGRKHEWYMIQLNIGQSVQAFTRSSGLPNSGRLLVPGLPSGEGESPL